MKTICLGVKINYAKEVNFALFKEEVPNVSLGACICLEVMREEGDTYENAAKKVIDKIESDYAYIGATILRDLLK